MGSNQLFFLLLQYFASFEFLANKALKNRDDKNNYFYFFFVEKFRKQRKEKFQFKYLLLFSH